MDKIIINSLRLFAYHGVNPEEQEDGQFFILDIEADIPLSKAGESDDLNDTVSYAQMIKCARRVFSRRRTSSLSVPRGESPTHCSKNFRPLRA